MASRGEIEEQAPQGGIRRQSASSRAWRFVAWLGLPVLWLPALGLACGGASDEVVAVPPPAPALPPPWAREQSMRDAGAAGADAAASIGVAEESNPEGLPLSRPDAGAAACSPGAAACDLVHGCGCSNTETCSVGADSQATCRPLPASPVAPYTACSFDDDCSSLHSCIGGVCKKHCETPADCGWPGASCLQVTDSLGSPIEGFKFCTRNCDVVSPQQPKPEFAACGPAASCVLIDTPFVTDCVPGTGGGAAGADCTLTECLPGHYCDGRNTCQRWCYVGQACSFGLSCVGFNTRFTTAGAGLGSCRCVPANGEECDPVTNCGCDRGETCGFDNPGRVPACRVLSPFPAAPYGLCDDDADCPMLHSCLGGVCNKQCQRAADCGWTGAQCQPIFGDAETPVPGWNYCTRHCDVVSPSFSSAEFQACGAGAQCFTWGDPPESDCLAAGNGGIGAACSGIFDCQPSLFCGSGGHCERWCHVGSSECGSGLGCRGFGPPLVVSNVEWGFCACQPESGGLCDLSRECGCEQGETCGFGEAPGSVVCRALPAAPSAPYEACVDSSTCPALHSCVGGVCSQQCNLVGDCGWPDATCDAPLDADGIPIPGWGHCARHCDLLSPQFAGSGFQPCGAGLNCSPSSDALQTTCTVPLASNADGTPCTSNTECAPGLLCDGTCRRWCRLNGADCDPGNECLARAPRLVLGANEYGACTPAAAPEAADPAADAGATAADASP